MDTKKDKLALVMSIISLIEKTEGKLFLVDVSEMPELSCLNTWEKGMCVPEGMGDFLILNGERFLLHREVFNNWLNAIQQDFDCIVVLNLQAVETFAMANIIGEKFGISCRKIVLIMNQNPYNGYGPTGNVAQIIALSEGGEPYLIN